MKTKAQKQKDLEALTEQFQERQGSDARRLSANDCGERSGAAESAARSRRDV